MTAKNFSEDVLNEEPETYVWSYKNTRVFSRLSLVYPANYRTIIIELLSVGNHNKTTEKNDINENFSHHLQSQCQHQMKHQKQQNGSKQNQHRQQELKRQSNNKINYLSEIFINLELLWLKKVTLLRDPLAPGNTIYAGVLRKEKNLHVLGDSMISGIKRGKFNDNTEENVLLETFRGAISEDILSYANRH